MTTIKFAEGVLERLRELDDLELGCVADTLGGDNLFMSDWAAKAAGLSPIKDVLEALRLSHLTRGAARSAVKRQSDPDLAAELGARIRRTLPSPQAEVTDLRRQKSDLEVALAATMTAWHKDKAALESTVAAVTEENAKTREAYRVAFASELGAERARFTSAIDKATAERDVATKRADLAEATLESVRAAVAKPVEDKQDGRPKVGDLVPWSEVEVGALYKVRTYDAYPFRVVSLHTTALCCGDDDRELESYLDGRYKGTPIDALADFHEGQTHATLIARDLGTDPEAWRAAMRECSAKVGK